VNFDNVRVPVANRLGREGEGFKVAMQVLDRGRLHISAVCVGVAERLLTDCVAYAPMSASSSASPSPPSS
jgi:acyl-CoA dehydrogenase